MNKKIVSIIDRHIKEMWINEIKNDYNTLRLLKEDTLKNAFYHHLRNRLGDTFLDEHNLRIFTEVNDGDLKGSGKRADIAIVKMKNPQESFYWGDDIETYIAIIELKYTSKYSATKAVYKDFNKFKEYYQVHKIDCQYYAGIITEIAWERPDWLNKKQTNNWANGRVTELVASYENDENNDMKFEVFSYNHLNRDLNSAL